MNNIIITNINKLQQYLPKNTRIGVWWVASLLHDGHLECLNILKNQSDFILGIYISNFYEIIEHITGNEISKDKKFSNDTLNSMLDLVDTLHVSYSGYTPYDRYVKNDINEVELPNYILPNFILSDLRTMSLLRANQVLVRKIHEITNYKFNVGSTKDPWRIYNAEWARKYLNICYTIIDPERDKFGNSLSSSFMTWQHVTGQKIDFQILQPWMRGSFEVEYLLKEKGIEGLKVISFFYDKNTNYIFTKIKFDNMFWSECLNIGDK
jgi:hypothetical protein